MKVFRQPQRWVAVRDADPAVRDSVASLIELDGLLVRSYATARRFLFDVQEQPMGTFHCVICDEQLPDATGLEVHGALTRLCMDIPFALMTSRRASMERRVAAATGIRYVLRKPVVDTPHFLAFVQRANSVPSEDVDA